MDFLHENPPASIVAHGIAIHAGAMDPSAYSKRGHVSLRQGRYSEAGRVYLVTFVTAARHAVFADWHVAITAVRASRSVQIWRGSRLFCWVLMPDHWHGLIELGDGDDLSALVNRLKGSTARAVNASRDRQGHLWSKGFHDHALRADEAVLDTARYIVINPVRAGIVRRVGQYPFWDAIWLDHATTASPEPPS